MRSNKIGWSMRLFRSLLFCMLLLLLAGGCITRKGESGVYGWVGHRTTTGYRPPTLRPVRGECIQVVDPRTWRTIARGQCSTGSYQVPLPPGKYVVLSPQGSETVTVDPHQWVENNVIFE
jgi:hypothetical protein